MSTHCMAQETSLGALWRPKQEGNPRKGTYVNIQPIHFAAQQKLTAVKQLLR